jgi:hypothetical protein
MTHAPSGASHGAPAAPTPDTPAGATSRGADQGDHDAAGERPVREAARQTARHIAGRLSALPRLAAAGAARARGAGASESRAERDAHRREAALEAAESGDRTDWAQVGVFSAGVVVGALIGAGAALLLAPTTGFETRSRLASNARRARVRAVDRLEGISEDARKSTKRSARRLGRVATSARWAAEDAWERRRARDA